MTSQTGEILYVGQSSNLRARLGSYRTANADHLTRRVLRLIHAVASITWERCASARLARVRENELLRVHRPKFNRMNTYPQGYWFIGLVENGDALSLCRSREAHRAPLAPRGSRYFYGAFKGGAVYGYGAWLRLGWSAVKCPRWEF